MLDEKLLEGTGLPEDVRQLVLDQITAGVQDLQLVVKQWGGHGASVAIRDDDFPVLREIATNVASLLAGTVIHAWAPAAIASLVVLLYTFRKNGIVLNPVQGALVRELKRRPAGLTAEEAADLADLPIEIVREELPKLQKLTRNDGVTVSIAFPNQDGRWRTSGV